MTLLGLIHATLPRIPSPYGCHDFKDMCQVSLGAESDADHEMSVAGHARNIPEAGGEQSA